MKSFTIRQVPSFLLLSSCVLSRSFGVYASTSGGGGGSSSGIPFATTAGSAGSGDHQTQFMEQAQRVRNENGGQVYDESWNDNHRRNHHHNVNIRNNHNNNNISNPSTGASPAVAAASADQFRGAYLRTQRHLDTVIFISSANMLINTFRPDDDVTWQMRLPRICWEACILTVANAAKESPINMLLLCFMTGSTAMIDIFLWGPLISAFTSFETCTGGGWFSGQPKVCTVDYVRGFSRIVATFQSIFGGLFYLMTAVVLWNDYWALKLEYKYERQAAAMTKALDERGMLPGGYNINNYSQPTRNIGNGNDRHYHSQQQQQQQQQPRLM